MDYQCPMYPELGGIGSVMNPMFVDNAIALGPTRVMAAPDEAGYATTIQYGLDGRHGDRDFFAPGQWALSGFREYLDVFTAAAFLFPE